MLVISLMPVMTQDCRIHRKRWILDGSEVWPEPLKLLSMFFQTANAADQTNVRDDAGLPIVYGSCKLLDMLGYGSMIDSTNKAKAAITQKYLGVESPGDTYNPLFYQTSQTVNALPFLAYQKIYYDFFSNNQSFVYIFF